MKMTRGQQFVGILNQTGFTLSTHSTVLDFGCGAGNLVMELIEQDYDAYGCDLSFKNGQYVEVLHSEDRLRQIDPIAYQLPFDDDTFDVVVSDQVLEHVQDYPAALSELSRVMKPDGACLHMFPSRYRPVECHALIPLASIVQLYWWLRFWAALGIRNPHQVGKSAAEVADINRIYLTTRTNYLSRRDIHREFSAFFQNVSFEEGQYLRQTKRGHFFGRLMNFIPLLPRLYSTFSSRVLLASKTKPA